MPATLKVTHKAIGADWPSPSLASSASTRSPT